MMMMMMLTMMIHSRFGPSNVIVGAFIPKLPSSLVGGKARAPSASRRSWGSGNQGSLESRCCKCGKGCCPRSQVAGLRSEGRFDPVPGTVMSDSGVVGECNVRDRDGGLPRPRGRFLCLTVILKRDEYNLMKRMGFLGPDLLGEMSSSCIPMHADDAIAWVTALSSSRHLAAVDFSVGRWTRFTIRLTDEQLEDLLRTGALCRPGAPGRDPYRVAKAIPLETLVREIQNHVVVPVAFPIASPEEKFFPGAWWHGRVGRMRSLGETHFRPGVVDQALVLQENHPLRLCVIPRPLSDWSSDLRAADHLCTQCAKNMQRTHSLLCDMLCSISCKHGEQSKAGEGAGKIARIHTVALARCICAQCHLHALEGSAIMVWKQ